MTSPPPLSKFAFSIKNSPHAIFIYIYISATYSEDACYNRSVYTYIAAHKPSPPAWRPTHLPFIVHGKSDSARARGSTRMYKVRLLWDAKFASNKHPTTALFTTPEAPKVEHETGGGETFVSDLIPLPPLHPCRCHDSAVTSTARAKVPRSWASSTVASVGVASGTAATQPATESAGASTRALATIARCAVSQERFTQWDLTTS